MLVNAILCGAMLITSPFALAQKAIAFEHFSAAQKAEWRTFYQHWNGNGNGTCMPMMEEQIRVGRCTRFDFLADLTIGKDGNIRRVSVTNSKVTCHDKAVQKELLVCFTGALRDATAPLTRFKGRVIRDAPL